MWAGSVGGSSFITGNVYSYGTQEENGNFGIVMIENPQEI